MIESHFKTLEPFWGVWYIDEKLGSGSYGSVYRIKREEFDDTYEAALKVITVPPSDDEIRKLKVEGMDDESIRKYFQSFISELVKEFSLMSKLKGHSNIVSYEDHMVVEHPDKMGWDLLIRMELLTPLDKYLSENRLDEKTIVSMGIDICNALEKCSQYNIIHRDIKPDNVFVSQYGKFKLGDFGVARIAESAAQTMSVKGTVNYMAPEVYKGEKYDATVDIYSLGVMLYKLSNNNRGPFLPPAPEPITYSDRETAEKLRMNGQPFPDAANAGPELMRIIRKASAFKSKDRYSTPGDLKDELETVLYGEALENTRKSKSVKRKSEKENTGSKTGNTGKTGNSYSGSSGSKEYPSAAQVEATVSDFPKDIHSDGNKSGNGDVNAAEKQNDLKQSNEKNGKKKYILAATVAVFMLLGLIIGVGYRGSRNKDNSNSLVQIADSETEVSNTIPVSDDVIQADNTKTDNSVEDTKPTADSEDTLDLSSLEEPLFSYSDYVLQINPLIWKLDASSLSDYLQSNGYTYLQTGDCFEVANDNHNMVFTFEYRMARRISKLVKIEDKLELDNSKDKKYYSEFGDKFESVLGKADHIFKSSLFYSDNLNEAVEGWKKYKVSTWLINMDSADSYWQKAWYCKTVLDSEKEDWGPAYIEQELIPLEDISVFFSFEDDALIVNNDEFLLYDYEFTRKLFSKYGEVGILSNVQFEDANKIIDSYPDYKGALLKYDNKTVEFVFWAPDYAETELLEKVVVQTDNTKGPLYYRKISGEGVDYIEHPSSEYLYAYKWAGRNMSFEETYDYVYFDGNDNVFTEWLSFRKRAYLKNKGDNNKLCTIIYEMYE